MFNICRFQFNWNKRDYFNALNQKWSHYTFINPPYSLTAAFLAKGVLEYRREKNIVMIIPSICLDNKNLRRWLKLIQTKINTRIRVGFSPHQHKYNKQITVIGFLQPQIIEKIIRKNDDQRNKKSMHQNQLEAFLLRKR